MAGKEQFPMVIGRILFNMGAKLPEHPNDTSERVTWPSVTTGVAQLPVAHAHTQGNPEGVKWPLVTSSSHGTTILHFVLLRKNAGEKTRHAQNILLASFGHVTAGSHRTYVTSGQKAPLGRILCNFRLLMRRKNFRAWHVTDVTSGHVTSGSSTANVIIKHAYLSRPTWLDHKTHLSKWAYLTWSYNTPI
jgi:hypothetical protein